MAKFSFARQARATALVALFATGHAFAVGPGLIPERFPDYNPAHTVIKCPYLPPDLRERPLCGGQPATCVGTDGADLILGTEANDVIVAGGGRDVVHGDAGDDILCGGPGPDSLMMLGLHVGLKGFRRQSFYGNT